MTPSSSLVPNPNHLAVYDSIDELEVGCGVTFTNGVHVERESPTRFVIESQTLCFVEACDLAIRGIDGLCGIKTLSPDDIIRPCILQPGHEGFCDPGVR